MVWLVNAAQAKNVPGRPKTDKIDAVWLAKLAERSMVSPSLVPTEPMRQVRDLARARFDLVEDRTRVKQRIEKLLEDALIKISSRAHRHPRGLRPGDDRGVDRRAAQPEGAGRAGQGPGPGPPGRPGTSPRRPVHRSPRPAGPAAARPARRAHRAHRRGHRAARRRDPCAAREAHRSRSRSVSAQTEYNHRRAQRTGAPSHRGHRHRRSRAGWRRPGRVGVAPPARAAPSWAYFAARDQAPAVVGRADRRLAPEPGSPCSAREAFRRRPRSSRTETSREVSFMIDRLVGRLSPPAEVDRDWQWRETARRPRDLGALEA